MKKFTSIILFCFISTITFSQDARFEKGLKAFDSKQFMKSFKIMQPYANSGDKVAQFIVGFCYYSKDQDMLIQLEGLENLEAMKQIQNIFLEEEVFILYMMNGIMKVIKF